MRSLAARDLNSQLFDQPVEIGALQTQLPGRLSPIAPCTLDCRFEELPPEVRHRILVVGGLLSQQLGDLIGRGFGHAAPGSGGGR